MAAAVTFIVFSSGCTKDDVQNTATTGQVNGVAKSAPSRLFQMNYGTGVKNFGVQFGCNGCYGLIQNATASTNNTMGLISQGPNSIMVEGFTDPMCMNTVNCRLDKVPGTPIYYIVPNQGPAVGRKILQLRVISPAPPIPSWANAPFQYNVVANSWSIEASASAYFQTAVVTSVPASTCCFPC